MENESTRPFISFPSSGSLYPSKRVSILVSGIDIAKDIGESTDLATGELGRVVELQKRYDTWSAQQAEPTVKDTPANNAPKKNVKKKKGA